MATINTNTPFFLRGPTASHIYWADSGINKIQRSLPQVPPGETPSTRTDIEDIETTSTNPTDIAIDAPKDKMFWIDGADIKTSDLQGSGVTIIVSGLSLPQGIDVDTVNEKIYWTDLINDNIKKADYDGLNQSTVLSSLFDPRGITIHQASGFMFWTQTANFNNKVGRANLDGSNKIFIATSLGDPNKIVVDEVNDKLYWTDSSTQDIFESDIIADTPVSVVSVTGFLLGLGIDPIQRILYFGHDEGVGSSFDQFIKTKALIADTSPEIFVSGVEFSAMDDIIVVPLIGPTLINSRTPLFIDGFDNIQSNTPLFVTGINAIQANSPLFLSNKINITNVPLFLKVPEQVTSNIPIFLKVPVQTTNNTPIFMTGESSIQTNVPLMITGGPKNTRDVFVKGYKQPDKHIPMFVHGTLSAGNVFFKNTNIPLFITNNGINNRTKQYGGFIKISNFPVTIPTSQQTFTFIIPGNKVTAHAIMMLKTGNSVNSNTPLFMAGSSTTVSSGFTRASKLFNCFVAGDGWTINNIPVFISGVIKTSMKNTPIFLTGKKEVSNNTPMFISGITGSLSVNTTLFIKTIDNINVQIRFIISGF